MAKPPPNGKIPQFEYARDASVHIYRFPHATIPDVSVTIENPKYDNYDHLLVTATGLFGTEKTPPSRIDILNLKHRVDFASVAADFDDGKVPWDKFLGVIVQHLREQLVLAEHSKNRVAAQNGINDSHDGSEQKEARRWIIGAGGRYLSCQHNVLMWLDENGYTDRIALDTFKQVIAIDDLPLTDDLTIEMVRRIEESTRTHWAETHVHSALVSLGNRHAQSSLTSWLNSLAWDGKPRLWKFFTEAYNSELSDYTDLCAKVLFISAVARAFEPGCQADVMVVLIGPQGIGKSRGIAELVPNQGWYTDDLGGDLYDRKAGEGLQGKWLIEFGEFARINRATLDVVKSFLSRRVDHYRPAYGRVAKDFPRQCVFVGTTNNDFPLQDLENRRFMPVKCPQPMANIASQRDQLWAEAVARYKSGEPWWIPDQTLLTTVKDQQENARQHDEWEELLRISLAPVQRVTLAEAAGMLRIPVDRLDKSTQTRLGLVLKTIGWHSVREKTGARERYYVRN